jgi:hypothetical protein
MDWKEKLMADEKELKALVNRLNETRGSGLRVRLEREYLMRCLSRKLVEMHAFVDDCMSGRNAYEQSLMAYKLRVQYPLYSQMDSLASLPRQYVDWSCA